MCTICDIPVAVCSKVQEDNLPFSSGSGFSSLAALARNRVEPSLPRRARFTDELYGSILSTNLGKLDALMVPCQTVRIHNDNQ